MTNFKNGDKVRVLDKSDTIPEWVGAEGFVIDNSGFLLTIKLTTEVKDPNNWKKVGDTARMYEDGLELVVEPVKTCKYGIEGCPCSLEEEPVKEEPKKVDLINDPPHYGGKDDPFEVIKVAEAWGLDKDAYLFNVLKYIARASKKGAKVEDLKKGSYYINRRIAMEEAK